MTENGLIISIVGVGVALGTLILATDDGARIDARMDALDAKIDALGAKVDARIDVLDAKIDALDAKIDDIRVFIAAKHGETVSFTLEKEGSHPRWSIAAVDPATGAASRIGTLAVQGGSERRAVLQAANGKIAREWTHLGNADTLQRAKALTVLALSK